MRVEKSVVVDASRFRTQRDWVQGFVHNPVFPDSPYGTYFYTISKAAKGDKGAK